MASKEIDPQSLSPQSIDEKIGRTVKGELQYYHGEIHQGQFLLPKHIRQRIEQTERIIEDNTPLFTYH